MSDSSLPTSGFGHNLEPSANALETGLAALHRKDYRTAIAHLTQVCQADCDRVTLVQAQMALVKAYRRVGDVQQARALCKTLSQSPSRKVRAWAAESLTKLGSSKATPRQPSIAEPSDTFGAASNTSGATSDRTGFVPLAALPQPAAREQIDLPEPTPETIPEESFENPFQLSDQATIAEPSAPQSTVRKAIPPKPQAAPRPQTASTGRAQKWTALGTTSVGQLAVLEVGTAIALIWLVYAVVVVTLSTINHRLALTVWPIDLREWAVFYRISIWPVIFAVAALFASAPWLLDAIFRQFYGLKPFSLSELERSSPEASRLLKRVCSQRRLTMPTLNLLAIDAPVAFTYGNLQRTARIVLSRGLLAQLDEAEVAAICAGELAHIVYWDFAPLTLVLLVTQLPYLLYWQVAAWGDRYQNPALRAIAAVVSAISYGLYWLWRWPGLWLARLRQYYSDRFACDLTGNPNGLAQALLKLTSGTAKAIQQQGNTSPLLESCDLLLPIAPRTAFSSDFNLLESSLQWDLSNPGRHWLTLNHTHPRLGDRLSLLARYARHWRLNPAIDLHPTRVQSRRLRLQAAPFLGIGAGLAIALLLWFVGAVADLLNWSAIDWLKGDRGLLWGFMLIGFSIGTLLRINAFFPDIRSTNLQENPALTTLLSDPARLPADSQPVRLRGKLLGRSGIRNWLVQDLLLQTDDGLIKLHYLSQLGAAGNLLLHPHRPDTLVQRSVTVTGWFRRGATPWIDVDTLQPQRGTTFRSGHPLWSTLLAIAAALLGIFCILQS